MISKLLSNIKTKNNIFRLNKSSNMGIKTLVYGKNIQNEQIYEKSDYPREKIESILKGKNISVLGYGTQGRAQALNLRDMNMNVNLGLRKNSKSWDKAVEDGFYPNYNLFSIDEAVYNGNIIMNLLSDAGQMQTFNIIKKNINKGDTLYFSHGFNVVFSDYTKFNINELPEVDVIMVAPKGSGNSVRKLFLEGKGINSSYAVYQDVTGSALNTTLALGFAIGSPYMYSTTFRNEVYSDLTGERSILMGGIAGLFKAQYDVLRENGHSPSEAYNETVEEALQSLYPLINEKGMDYMFSECSTTAQRGALDWYSVFEKLNKPLIRNIYKHVKNGNEVNRVLESNSDSNYKVKLNQELDEINNQEIWKVGKIIRKLRK
jgi:ketol-acid reductoisomerase